MDDSIQVVAPHLGALTSCAKTLEELTARRTRVHVIVHGEPPPGADLTVFARKFRRLTIGHAPPPDAWSVLATTVRGWLDCWRHLEPDADDEAYHRALREAPPLAAQLASSRWFSPRPIRRTLAALLRAVERAMPSSPAITEFLRAHKPGILIIVPLFEAGAIGSCYVQAAAELGIPTFAFPLRWDDVMRGALLHRLPNCVALWNRDQRGQIVERLGVPARRTLILGASLRLDVATPSQTTRDALCAQRGLDPARPIVFCAPGPSPDSTVLTQWVDSLRTSLNPSVRDANVLVHFDPPRGVEQTVHPPIPDSLVVPRPSSDPAQYDADIVAALTHADVVVAWDTTLVFEAAARGRPTVALLWPDGGDRELARACDEIGESRGWPVVACSLEEHAAAIAELLEKGLSAERCAAARTWVRPHGPTLPPGFLMSARVFPEVVYRGEDVALARPASTWTRLLLAPLARLAAHRSDAMPQDHDAGALARVLFGVASAKSLFLHQPLLRVLAERGHRLSVVFTAPAGYPVELYERVRCDVPGVEVVGTLASRGDTWGAVARGLSGLACLATLSRYRQAGSVTPSWLVRYATVVLPARLGRLGSIMVRLPVFSNALGRVAGAASRIVPASRDASTLLSDRRPDVVVILPDDDAVPAFESAGAQGDLMRAAASLRIPVVAGAGASEAGTHALITSSRAGCLWVWNEDQRDMARAEGVSPDRLVVTGAVPLDRCLDDPPVVTRDEFHDMLGLPADRPFVLFAGASGLMSEPGAEAELLQSWIQTLRDNTDPLLRRLTVLVRPSPLGVSRWRALDFAGDADVVVCPDTFERSGELDAVLLAESVRFARATVGADPLALLMAAALDRPAIAVVPPRVAPGDADLPFDYLWKASGSSVRRAGSLEDLTAFVRATLEAAEPASPSGRFLCQRVRPHGAGIPSVIAAGTVERSVAQSPWRFHGPLVRSR